MGDFIGDFLGEYCEFEGFWCKCEWWKRLVGKGKEFWVLGGIGSPPFKTHSLVDVGRMGEDEGKGVGGTDVEDRGDVDTADLVDLIAFGEVLLVFEVETVSL
jgi:hypothetical protein